MRPIKSKTIRICVCKDGMQLVRGGVGVVGVVVCGEYQNKNYEQ